MNAERKRVLLVDDDPDLVWGIGRCLTRASFFVVTCGDGAEAVELLESTAFDILVTDIQMPKLNGLALIDWVHHNRPAMRVVVMTAFGSPYLRNLALRKGAILYLEKPVDPDMLIEVLQSPTSDGSFSGSINAIDLFDYVQLLLMTRRQAVLEVSDQCGERGLIFIDRGDIRHAACGDLHGEVALFRCLAFESGNFSTLPWREPERVSIGKRGDYLLLEAARLKDEAQRDQAMADAIQEKLPVEPCSKSKQTHPPAEAKPADNKQEED